MGLSARRLPSLLQGPGEPGSPALGSTMKALRLPIRVSAVAYLLRSRRPRDPSSFVLALSAPRRAEVPSGPGPLLMPATPISGLLARGREWDLSGLQAIHSVPLLRSRTPVEPTRPRHNGRIDAAPAIRTTKASAMADFGANPQLRHLLSYASRYRCRHVQSSLPADWLVFAGRESNPLDRYERFQLVLSIILPSCSPDATGLRCAPSGLRMLTNSRE